MSLLPDDFAYLRKRVLRRSGLVLEPDTHALVETRLTPLMREEHLPDISALVARLRSQPESSPLHQRLAEALANHETAFFRDAPVFDALRTTVLPALLAKRSRTRTLRIWCAACAYGQEPYSVAMTLAEAGLLITGWTVRILATDFSTRALMRASEARYDAQEIHRGLSPKLRQRYFHQDRDKWRLNEQVRRPVEFRPLNLMDDFPPEAPVDLVFLRNVMIYWDATTRHAVLARVRRMIHAEGYLVLGAAEASPLGEDGFTRHLIGQTSWYRPTPASQTSAGAPMRDAPRPPRSGATP
ncbi:protein-glutamate O-methyltransferase CheR [Corallococcus macrosporus]|uniref:protein-glutamate O-methyltransferase n=1 Tax=Corallococcus macrosporus TaxID=35 RepID=A0ABS3DLX8_9BACT|nr:protein-glutamate O-methyltransferase CheR [Corallococcus macrosporus]MBN8232332.1 protein-glutamate O-methyltransferase CheR [Corallococcus macrosporus]